MDGYWRHKTRIGEARIIWRGKRYPPHPWRIELTGEDLGGYPSPQSALDDLVGGHPYSHSSGVDTSTLGLPDELADWEFIRSR